MLFRSIVLFERSSDVGLGFASFLSLLWLPLFKIIRTLYGRLTGGRLQGGFEDLLHLDVFLISLILVWVGLNSLVNIFPVELEDIMPQLQVKSGFVAILTIAIIYSEVTGRFSPPVFVGERSRVRRDADEAAELVDKNSPHMKIFTAHLKYISLCENLVLCFATTE